MRRTVLGSLVVIASLLVPTSASAANSTVVSRIGVPAPMAFHVDSNSCGTGPFTGSAKHVKGPKTPPLGTGSLKLSVGKQSAADLSGNLSSINAQLGDLTALSVSSYVAASSASMAKLAQVTTQPDGSNRHWVGRVQLPGAVAEWTPFDVLSSTVDLTWTEYNQNNTQIGSSVTKSYGNFTADHPTLLVDSVGVTLTNCATSTRSINLDDLKFGINGSTTTVNFERAIGSRLVGHLSSKRVRYHGKVTPRATLTSSGSGFHDQLVSLWAKRTNAKRYNKVARVVTGVNGAAIAPVQRPKVNTTYQWRYAGDGTTHSPTKSSPDTVSVRSKVRFALERRSVPKGDAVSGGGSVTPRHNHLRIALWAKRVSGHGKHHSLGKPVKVATTKLRRDGTYRVSGKVGPGSYRVFTTTAADKTNAAGRSHPHNFTVRP
jgi:hypothetical protein